MPKNKTTNYYVINITSVKMFLYQLYYLIKQIVQF